MDILEKERIVQKNVLQIFKENFKAPYSEDEILNYTPSDVENTAPYYESILDIFFIEQEYLQSVKGCVKDTIKKVAELWHINPYAFGPWEESF
ncbi:hypothetical protein [uncultured Aquimarina sp.]|uniref:hypothetical protein n=1 Tax=uncultured Aquimarina sp. TaxID=575652 RepID=UPI002629EAF5|nr:hypothetical protein [uncultured Aquimarina sp.]